VLVGAALPAGWTGKLWALEQGIRHATAAGDAVDYFLLTDADIGHAPDNLSQLVARAERDGRVQVSLMAELSCVSAAERFLIPAFVYFFQMLYPFAWINDKRKKMGGAAGGCMLVARKALKNVGGIAAIKDALIDDCALGRKMKGQGPIWLGLANGVRSLRGYPEWGDVWRLIARSAFTQLHHSLMLLLVCVVGLSLTFLAPPLLTIQFDPGMRGFGMAAWALMSLTYIPTLLYYRQPVWWAPLLPLIALFYVAATVDSARRHLLGKGGEWKGRLQAQNLS
jgi:hopene-associated glycosyltransferase HpnB